ncbi:hypothetical protein SM124_20590 [Bacillus sp. 31A1R]|uniref:Uncharacterized protein n=1 Tax=Robertmurraya mangrovi TaxID=3098077 RepID=A0ABU5J3V6_9BACI|nr:hypothetical protein [Bacillus sp. 31A1R]MDZ5474105.1 hypothetical protein [Bacillus sp. 31A1R]
MGIEVNLYVKKSNGTVPLNITQPSNVISQLLHTGVAQHGDARYQYEDIRIQKQSVSIFVSQK